MSAFGGKADMPSAQNPSPRHPIKSTGLTRLAVMGNVYGDNKI